jgi:formylglycine-generating enzyme required for sulfatase activity
MNRPFAPIPEGWFRMGSDDGPEDERPPHRVWVDAFEMAVYPVTARSTRRSCAQRPHDLRATGPAIRRRLRIFLSSA